MRGVYYSACSLCYKTIAQFHQKCLLMRDCLLFRRLLLLPESTVHNNWTHSAYKFPLERRHLWKPLFSLESETHCDDARAFTINEGRLILS